MINLSGLSISFFDLLVKGIPESFLFVLAVYIFTRIKIEIKKYLILSFLITIITFLIRLLPITLGVHTILSLLSLIILFIIFYKVNLQILIKTIISVIVIAIIVIISEELNLVFLLSIYGSKKTEQLLNSPTTVSIYSIPSTIFFAVIVLIAFLVLSLIDRRKKGKNGVVSEKTGK
jgi:hypothetical protein